MGIFWFESGYRLCTNSCEHLRQVLQCKEEVAFGIGRVRCPAYDDTLTLRFRPNAWPVTG